MSKTQRWDWAIGLKLEELNDQHLQAAYKLNWNNLCRFDACRKNCKKVLCLGCFDRSWVDSESPNISFDSFDGTNFEQKRTNLKTFVGLKNLGATCYVNCLLQLWFHNPALRKAIYEWKCTEGELGGAELDQTRSSRVGDNSDCQLLQICDVREQKQIQKSSDNSNTKIISQSKRALEDVEDVLLTTPNKKMNREITESNGIDKNDSISLEPTRPTSTIKPKKATSSDLNHNENLRLARELVPNNPIQQLQLIFARLQFTNKKSIDPFNFIESLALNAAEQQDAQEFGNLFLEFLERSFSGQSSSFVSKIIQEQFCGRYSYATICDSCRHSSLQDSQFYELDLSIQNLETLHDCLNEYFRPFVLDGKYNCGHCQKAQSAHRKIILKSLPPTLNLQLLRFVYDKQRNVRQKLNSHIIFPEVLDMDAYLNNANSKSRLGISGSHNNNSITRQQSQQQQLHSSKSNIYFLSAVLIHRGSSPHSGHYIAHIKDRISKDWYKFNDDTVERIGSQLQVSTDGENISIVEDKTELIKVADPVTNKITRVESKSLKSKTAYMLVYQAQDNEALTYPSDHSEKWQLPEHLQTAVAEENSRSDELFESIQLAREVDIQIMDARRNQVKTLYSKLVCRDPSEKFEFISKKWLQNWLTNSSTSAKFSPIDNSDLLCIHDKLDFRKIDQAKCVKSEGADALYKEYGGGPRLVEAMCRSCVELEIKLIQLKDRMKEDQKFITSQAKFKLDASYDFADAYIVGKNSYRDWQALVMVQFKKSNPELLKRKSRNGVIHGDSDDDDKNGNSLINSKENQEPKSNSTNVNNPGTNGQEGESDSDSDDEAMEKFIFNSDILCEHEQLLNDTNAWRIVPKEVWQIFKNYFGNIPDRPLIEYNANTIMCAECKRQEVEQQEIGDIQKQKASEQKAKLPDLFHNRKRASWCSMMPGDVYYALDRQFLAKWQKFIRNPCNQEQPTEIVHLGKLICDHRKSIYDQSNSNPILPDCRFALISRDELDILKQYYPIDHEIKFTINPNIVEKKIKLYKASRNNSNPSCVNVPKQKQPTPTTTSLQSPLEGSNGASIKPVEQQANENPTMLLTNTTIKSEASNKPTSFLENFANRKLMGTNIAINIFNKPPQEPIQTPVQPEPDPNDEDVDLNDIDWSDCVISEPRFCSECHETMKQQELRKLLNYESTTIYITKVENTTPTLVHGSSNGSVNSTPATNYSSANNNFNSDCDIDTKDLNENNNVNNYFSTGNSINIDSTKPGSNKSVVETDNTAESSEGGDELFLKKRRAKMYTEDEANDFVPPGNVKVPGVAQPSPNSPLLRRTTRRNRNRQQAYTIKPNQTLLELKKEIFQRCQVLPVDQRLFLNDELLDDNSKTMSELRIVPNCNLKLEVDKPVGDMIDLIEDEPNSRKSYAQPETGFKGSLLLSNSHS